MLARATFLAAAVWSLCLALARGSSSGFVAAPDAGARCPAVCATVSQTPAELQQFNAPAPILSYACAANISGQGLVPGHQLSGNTTCTVAMSGSVYMYNDFSCLCLAPQAQMGLVNADSQPCDFQCNQTVDGLIGSAVQPPAATPSDTCIPLSDVGKLNRFGHTGDLGGETLGCFSAENNAPYTTATFSCLCLFQPPAAALLSPAAQTPLSTDAVATGG